MSPFLPCVPQMSESETLITMVNRMVETSSPRAQLYMQVRLRPPGPAWLVPGRPCRSPGVTSCHPGSPAVTRCHLLPSPRHIPLSGERAAPSQALLYPIHEPFPAGKSSCLQREVGTELSPGLLGTQPPPGTLGDRATPGDSDGATLGTFGDRVAPGDSWGQSHRRGLLRTELSPGTLGWSCLW